MGRQITGGIDAAHARLLLSINPDQPAFFVELAIELCVEVGGGHGAEIEEERIAVERAPIVEAHAFEPTRLLVAFEFTDAASNHGNVEVRETRAVLVRQALAIAARNQRQLIGPRQKSERESDRLPPAAENGDALISHFKAVAIRAVMHGRAVEVAKAGAVRQQITQARGEQQPARFKRMLGCFSAARRNAKALVRDAFNLRHARFHNQPAMQRDLIAPARQKFGRQNAVMSEKAVDAVRVNVARAVVMKRQHTAAVTSQKERPRQPRRACADNDAVVKIFFTHKCSLRLLRASISTCCRGRLQTRLGDSITKGSLIGVEVRARTDRVLAKTKAHVVSRL